ncbi:MAG: XdhC family protein [Oscillospiraceae bacterium]|nr:XdhC family protein [Oscillospiraceae bacterium]
MEKVFQQAKALLEGGEEFVLAAVAGSAGSTPRKSGAKMLIKSDGSIIATIGGGAAEKAVINRAISMPTGGGPAIMDFDLDQGPDAVCGGKERIILGRAKISDLPVFRAVTDAINDRREAVFVMTAEERPEIFFCVKDDGTVVSSSPPDESVKKILAGVAAGAGTHAEPGCPDIYSERIVSDGVLYIFGGGHVALATARAAEIAGFDTAVLDEHPKFANADRFPHSRVIPLDSFNSIPDLKITPDDYILIVTRGHDFDLVCLEWALKTPACYIGMIGSKTKRDLIYRRLEKDGCSREELAAVRCPVGLPLGGSAPGEIAISVAAELIKTRAEKKK